MIDLENSRYAFCSTFFSGAYEKWISQNTFHKSHRAPQHALSSQVRL